MSLTYSVFVVYYIVVIRYSTLSLLIGLDTLHSQGVLESIDTLHCHGLLTYIDTLCHLDILRLMINLEIVVYFVVAIRCYCMN